MWWAELVPFKHDAWIWGWSDLIILFLTVWGSFRCFFVNSKCVLTEERIEFGHTAIKPSSVECCCDVSPISTYDHGAQLDVHSSVNATAWAWTQSNVSGETWKCASAPSNLRVTIRFLVSTLTKALLHQLLRSSSSRKSPGRFKRLLLKITDTTCFCETSMKQNFLLSASSDLWLDSNLFLSSTCSSFFYLRA